MVLNLPPGVSPSDPHLTGIWPCVACGGGPSDCVHCKGTGNEPEEFDLAYLESLVAEGGDRFVIESVVAFVRCCDWDRSDPDERRYLRAAVAMKRGLSA